MASLFNSIQQTYLLKRKKRKNQGKKQAIQRQNYAAKENPFSLNPVETPFFSKQKRSLLSFIQCIQAYPKLHKVSLKLYSSLFFIIACVLSLYFMQGYIQKTAQKLKLFELKDLILHGVQRSNPYEIAILGDLRQGKSLLFLDIKDLEQKISSLATVEAVRVKRSYPNTLNIYIAEKKVFFVWRNKKVENVDNQFTLLSKEGTPIIKQAGLGHEYLGTTVQNLQLGDYFLIESDVDLDAFLEKNPLKKDDFAQGLGEFSIENFFSIVQNLPEEEQDFFSLFSGINLEESKQGIRLYTQDNSHTFYLGNTLSLAKLRKARYTYLYMMQTGIQHKKADISGKYVHFLSS